jgi:hypothetical protein
MLMTQEQAQAYIARIEQIYEEFHQQLDGLHKQQTEVISNFIKSLEDSKLNELRNIISKSNQ